MQLPDEPRAPGTTSDSSPSSASAGPEQDAGAGAKAGASTIRRRLGEVCPEIIVIMPFVVPLLLAMRLRKWLRRRVGRRAGSIIGKVGIIAFGGPPLLVAGGAVLLMRLVLKVLSKLEQVMKARRTA